MKQILFVLLLLTGVSSAYAADVKSSSVTWQGPVNTSVSKDEPVGESSTSSSTTSNVGVVYGNHIFYNVPPQYSLSFYVEGRDRAGNNPPAGWIVGQGSLRFAMGEKDVCDGVLPTAKKRMVGTPWLDGRKIKDVRCVQLDEPTTPPGGRFEATYKPVVNTWTLMVIVKVHGYEGLSSSSIPDFVRETDCQAAANYAINRQGVYNAFCVLVPKQP